MQIWYADDASVSGKLVDLKEWWNNLATNGPEYSYYTNALKSVVITKPTYLEEATKLFSGSGVRITADGERYLGMPIGSEAYRTTFIENNVISQKGESICLNTHVHYTTSKNIPDRGII